MIALYTETLKRYIENGGNTFEQRFNVFPTFQIGTMSYSLYELFLEKYNLREIGAETEQLFEYYLGNKINEVNIKYAKKVEQYIARFDKILDRTVQLSNTGDNARTGNSADKSYVNPITDTGAKLQDLNTSTDDYNSTWNEKREQVFSYFKTNAELMKSFLEIDNIFYTALNEFNELFIGVY